MHRDYKQRHNTETIQIAERDTFKNSSHLAERDPTRSSAESNTGADSTTQHRMEQDKAKQKEAEKFTSNRGRGSLHINTECHFQFQLQAFNLVHFMGALQHQHPVCTHTPL
jgi:hypothetical protein